MMFEDRINRKKIGPSNQDVLENIQKKSESLLGTFSSIESHLRDQVKIAISDCISGKTFQIKTFDDLRLALVNINEIIHHPILSDELKEYGTTMLATLIEALIREEGAMKGLDFLAENVNTLDPKVIREVLPELTNPFMVLGDKLLTSITEKFIKDIEELLGLLFEGEGYVIKRRIKERFELYRDEIKKHYERREEKMKSKSYLNWVLILFFLLGLIFIIISLLEKFLQTW